MRTFTLALLAVSLFASGKLVAYRNNPPRSDESDIMVVAAAGGKPRNLTNSPGVADWSPAWSPDGRSIAFFSMRAGGRDLWVMRPDGSGKRRLTRDASLNEYPTWSPDGRSIAFQTARDGEFEIYVMSSDGRRQRNLSRHPSRDQWAAWSPDGTWIAFMSMRDGSDDVFVMRPDGSGVRNLTRTADLEESHPSWSPTGELTFTRTVRPGRSRPGSLRCRRAAGRSGAPRTASSSAERRARQGGVKMRAAGVRDASIQACARFGCATPEAVRDLVFLSVVIGFFAIAVLLVQGCALILGRRS